MKKIFLLFMSTFLFSIPSILAQDENQDLAEEAFYQLKNYCEQTDYEQAGKLLVYRGSDDGRKWKDYLRAEKKDELETIKLMCEEILELLNADALTIIGYVEDKESEGLWCVLKIELEKNGDKGNLVFAFLKLKIGMALGDIDK
jgi:hypothetical protein